MNTLEFRRMMMNASFGFKVNNMKLVPLIINNVMVYFN